MELVKRPRHRNRGLFRKALRLDAPANTGILASLADNLTPKRSLIIGEEADEIADFKHEYSPPIRLAVIVRNFHQLGPSPDFIDAMIEQLDVTEEQAMGLQVWMVGMKSTHGDAIRHIASLPLTAVSSADQSMFC